VDERSRTRIAYSYAHRVIHTHTCTHTHTHTPLCVSSQELNPDFFDWNLVLIPHCSGDMFLGQHSKSAASTWQNSFAGHFIVDAVLKVCACACACACACGVSLNACTV